MHRRKPPIYDMGSTWFWLLLAADITLFLAVLTWLPH